MSASSVRTPPSTSTAPIGRPNPGKITLRDHDSEITPNSTASIVPCDDTVSATTNSNFPKLLLLLLVLALISVYCFDSATEQRCELEYRAQSDERFYRFYL